MPSENSKGKGKKKISFFILFLGFLSVLALTYLLYIPQQKTIVDQELNVGDIAAEDIKVNEDITIEDKEASEEKKQRAVEHIVPVYEYHAEKEAKSLELLNRWFNVIREVKKDYIKNKNELTAIKKKIAIEFGEEFSDNELRRILDSNFFKKIDLNQLLRFVKSIYAKRVLASLTGARRSDEGIIKIVTKKREPVILDINTVYDLKKVETALTRFIREQETLNLNSESPQFIASVLMDLIDINISFSNTLTREDEIRAAAAVNPVLIKLKAGKVILRKGDELTQEDVKILKLVTHAEEIKEQTLSNFYLIFVILLLLALFGGKFFQVWRSENINKEKTLRVTAATLIVSAVVYRVCVFLFPLVLKNLSIDINYDMESIFLAIPFGFGALAIAFIFNLQSAVIYSFVNALVGGIVCQWDLRVVIYILLGNLAVSFGIEFYQRLKRSPIIKAAILWMLPVNLLTILVFNLTEPDTAFSQLPVDMIMGVFAAVVSPILANFIIPLWETIFSLVTDLKLIELTNLNLPIFREMLEKAPGTYHHSQMVASLSETAALDLGLSPLLQTAMALYHDIGKIDSPHYFTENHALYKNPHNTLSPRDSSKNIVAHIPDGMERAAKLKLPDVVSSSILQHHGTKVVRFFYDKARESSSVDSDGFDDKAFRYQGEKPKNIENAIIMLADQVEAASKSLASPTDEEIKNVIRKIIDTNVDENQFDECEGLTFKALNTIANSFHKKLSSIYHMRISYPGFDFKEKKETDKG
jgi:putative nucleotidyltransferase with HDIG domain